MAALIAVTYPNEDAARKAISTLAEMQKQQLIRIQDSIIATNQGDKVKLDQAVNLTGAGALSGAIWGGLIGLIFLVPVAGAVIGAAGGALTGKLSDYGINDRFAKDLAAKVGKGQAALIVMADSTAPDRVVDEMKKYNLGGEILYTNLSAEEEQRLRNSIQGA